MNTRLNIITFFLLIMCCGLVFSQEENDVWFHPNQGQWDDRVLYKVDLNKGDMIIEKDGFTFNFSDLYDVVNHSHDEEDHKHDYNPDQKIKRHAVFSKFENSSWKGELEEADSSYFYRNYFLGQDSTKWASEVRSVKKVKLIDFYPAIDLVLETQPDAIKYSFEVKPGADISQIVLNHNGADSVYLDNDRLYIATRFGAIEEQNLKVWNEYSSGRKREIKSSFKVEGNKVFFNLADDYDTTQRLIIDPEITFSSFSGSTADNWGFTAAPDKDANLFGGGIVFGTGYPLTQGAYDQTFNGGEGSFNIDIGITKFTADGSALLYSTYVGGSRNETPNSIISNDQGELYVLGLTSSTNFPIAGNPVQNNFAGGPQTTQNALQFSGTDLVIFKLNAAGTNLMSSTFYGGSGLDGMNIGPIQYNFGDQFRGEIVLDENSNVFITSSTRSNNFPTKNGFKTTFGGSQDAIAAKFSPDLSNVIWSTYIGAAGYQTGNALQVSSSGNVFVTGGTSTGNLILPGGGHSPNFNGGSADGYIIELNGNNSQPVNGTFIGTDAYDQSYFVQLDIDDNVYVFGQTAGNMSISENVYKNPNSGQFIRKYSPDLSELEWSTRVGGGNGNVEISPTAFLVSDCYEIYYAGWGGSTNQNSKASKSTTNGFPVTSDAFQSNTSGNNFYIAVLDEDASDLIYATFMGGTNSSPNHVDGGTSRFDKKGRIYHAVCAACGGRDNGFTSTPGAFSTTNESTNCNMAVFKFDLGIIKATLSVPSTDICIPNSITFKNNSENSSSFFWDFGDGNTSYQHSPTHTYQEPGVYEVILYANNSTGCYEMDSTVIEITVEKFEGDVVENSADICPGLPYQLEAYNGATYNWSPGEFLNDSTIADPIATVFESTTFTVVISDGCGEDEKEVTINVIDEGFEPFGNIEICEGDTAFIESTGNGLNYVWSPNEEIIGSNTGSSILTSPDVSTNFTLDFDTPLGCEVSYPFLVDVKHDVPSPIVPQDYSICKGTSLNLSVGGATSYQWSPDVDLSGTGGANVTASPTEDITYFIEFINACGSVTESINIEVLKFTPTISNNMIVCPDEEFQLNATGGIEYSWWPTKYIVGDSEIPSPTAMVSNNTTINVLVTDSCGSAVLSVDIEVYDVEINKETIKDTSICLNDTISLWASGGKSYSWEPSDQIISFSADESVITVSPDTTLNYFVDMLTPDGCTVKDTVFLEVNYLPNLTFKGDTVICLGDSTTIIAENADTYLWYPDQYISSTSGDSVVMYPPDDFNYFVDLTNQCGTVTDSIFITVIEIIVDAGNDTIVCRNEHVNLWASGGVEYEWSPAEYVYKPYSNKTKAVAKEATIFNVIVTDQYGCYDSAEVNIDLFPDPFVTVSPDYYGIVGDIVQLSAKGSSEKGYYFWSPADYLDCTDCTDPTTTTMESMTYTVEFEDVNGCIATNEVNIKFGGLVYVPNSFTPDGDGVNDYFYAVANNIKTFRMMIYNRWGELIFETTDLNEKWDGTYRGKPSPDGTYIWKITYADESEINQELIGHVNLLR